MRSPAQQTNTAVQNITSLVSLVVTFTCGEVRLSTLRTLSLFRLLHQPRMMDDDEFGTIGKMIER
jgi:hypothetical protein